MMSRNFGFGSFFVFTENRAAKTFLLAFDVNPFSCHGTD